MRIGLGYHNAADSREAGRQAARQAMDTGKLTQPALGIACCGSTVDAKEFYAGLRDELGENVPVIGGSAIGLILNDVLSYEGHPAGVALLEDDSLQIDVASADRLNEGGLEAGRRLAEQLRPSDEQLMLLFYDSLNQPSAAGSPAMMNPSGPILQGLRESNATVPVLGAGMLGDQGFSTSVQFSGQSVVTQHAVAALLRGEFHVDWQITHGCAPNDGVYHTVTRAEGPIVFEIDDRSAVEVIDEMYGSEEWQQQLPVKRLTLGRNMGERFALQYHEGDYVNRLILGPLPDKSGIVMFESDLEAGTEFQFMLRDSEAMLESARVQSRAILDRLSKEGKKPVWGLYVDCAGRSANFSDTLTEEAAEIQQAFNERGIPLFGFYSGVELAPFQGESRGLDWTGVLTVFSL